MTDFNNTDTPITANGDFTYDTVPGNMYSVGVDWTSGDGDITIKDHKGNAYRNEDDTLDLIITEISTVTGYDVRAAGRTITLTAENVANTPIAQPTVTNLGVRA